VSDHSEALSALSKTRHSTLHASFETALTRGPPRPIELHAHDPLRYVGDMLAWVHQAVAAEREFLEALFGHKADGRMVGSVRTFAAKGGRGASAPEEYEEVEEWIAEMMDGAVGGICGPLKVWSYSIVFTSISSSFLESGQARVQQTVRSQESSIVSYKIANLLQFYGLTMRRTIGEEAVLSKLIQESDVSPHRPIAPC
jgi:hypothetical protein